MRKKKINRLLFAAVDIGWRIPYYTDFLKDSLGDQLEVESFVKYKVPDKQYKASYTYHFNFPSYPAPMQWIIAFGMFVFALLKYSHFYFFSGETLLTRRLRSFELKVYKLLGKKVIFHFVGSDIRDPNYLKWKTHHIEDYLNGNDHQQRSQPWQVKLIRDAEKYADQIFVSTPDLIEICPRATYFPLVLNQENYKSELNSVHPSNNLFFKTDKIKILHAPSNPALKGTSIITKTLENLQKEFNFEFINTLDLHIDTGTVYPVSRYQLFQLYKEADLVIDQLIIGWYGVQSLEALMANCLVICYIDQNLSSYLGEDCPLIRANAENLGKVIAEILENPPAKQMVQTANWIEKNHSLRSVGQLLTDLF